MSKKQVIRDGIQKGQRKSAKRVNAERYIRFYEFLIYDPIYRELSHGSKILYTYLSDKMSYFEFKQKQYEEGEGTKSYVDEKGDLFIIADNTELTYLFNVSEPTLIRWKKELASYGLLEEIQVKNQANRIYVLEPVTLSERWAYIEEINKLREKRQEDRKKKYEKEKQKKREMKQTEKSNKREEIKATMLKNPSDLKNLSHGDLKNLSHSDLKNLSKIQSNTIKSKPNLLNNNLSILPEEDINQKEGDQKNDLKDRLIDDISNLNVHSSIKEILKNNIKRVISDSINLKSIEIISNAYIGGQKLSIQDFGMILNRSLQKAKKRIDDIENYLETSIIAHLNKNHQEKEKVTSNKDYKPARVEPIPDWLNNNKSNHKEDVEMSEEETEKLKKEVEDWIKKWEKEKKKKKNG
jgi:hypothetical protein